MKRILAATLIVLVLGGCAHTKVITETVTVTQYKYVIVKVPPQALVIEPAPEVPDPQTATDKDIAKFLLDQESRAIKLVNAINSILNYHVGAIDNLMKQGIKREDIIE